MNLSAQGSFRTPAQPTIATLHGILSAMNPELTALIAKLAHSMLTPRPPAARLCRARRVLLILLGDGWFAYGGGTIPDDRIIEASDISRLASRLGSPDTQLRISA